MQIKKELLNEAIENRLIEMSYLWQEENITHGYRKNYHEDLENETFYLAYDNDKIVGYLFGHKERSKEKNSIIDKDVDYFEIEEIYVLKEYRNQKIGQQLFDYFKKDIEKDVDYIFLSTANKNYQASLHFYLDILKLDFWSARLYSKIK